VENGILFHHSHPRVSTRLSHVAPRLGTGCVRRSARLPAVRIAELSRQIGHEFGKYAVTLRWFRPSLALAKVALKLPLLPSSLNIMHSFWAIDRSTIFRKVLLRGLECADKRLLWHYAK
jgi:hypothetical protein